MSFAREHRALAWIAPAALGAALILVAETLREPQAGAWRELTAGLGAGARAGVETGFFDYDPRLEVVRDGRLGPLPGAALTAGVEGAFSPSPPGRAADRR